MNNPLDVTPIALSQAKIFGLGTMQVESICEFTQFPTRKYLFDKPLVVKFGGSLLSGSREHDFETLRGTLLDYELERPLIVVVGGGERVRRLKANATKEDWSEEQAHWAAIRIMEANAQQFGESLENLVDQEVFAQEWSEVIQRARRPGATTVLLPLRPLRDIEPHQPGTKLPIGWHVTSDSIAARVAVMLGGALLLLKSCACETPGDQTGWQELAREGVVDDFFPHLVNEVNKVEIRRGKKRIQCGKLVQ